MNKVISSKFKSKELNVSEEIKETESQKIISEEEEEEIIESPENSDEDCKDVISQFTKIKKCSVLKYGINLSEEKIKYGKCHTCDANLMYPICFDCLMECHKKLGHDIREIEQPDFILCGCGERMHHFKYN